MGMGVCSTKSPQINYIHVDSLCIIGSVCVCAAYLCNAKYSHWLRRTNYNYSPTITLLMWTPMKRDKTKGREWSETWRLDLQELPINTNTFIYHMNVAKRIFCRLGELVIMQNTDWTEDLPFLESPCHSSQCSHTYISFPVHEHSLFTVHTLCEHWNRVHLNSISAQCGSCRTPCLIIEILRWNEWIFELDSWIIPCLTIFPLVNIDDLRVAGKSEEKQDIQLEM